MLFRESPLSIAVQVPLPDGCEPMEVGLELSAQMTVTLKLRSGEELTTSEPLPFLQ